MNEITKLMESYDNIPSLAIYRCTIKSSDIRKALAKNVPYNGGKLEEEFEILLTSVIKLLTEIASCQLFTKSKDTVIVNEESYKTAVKELVSLVNKDPKFFEELHKAWIKKFKGFLKQLLSKDRKPNYDDVIYQICEKFRIDSISSMKILSTL